MSNSPSSLPLLSSFLKRGQIPRFTPYIFKPHNRQTMNAHNYYMNMEYTSIILQKIDLHSKTLDIYKIFK